jgi:hypothetical protein
VKRVGFVIAAVLLAGCEHAQPPATPSAADASTAAVSAMSAASGMARYDGYGDMRFGMDEQAFRQAWQGELSGTSRTDGGCYYLAPKWVKSATDTGFMFEQGHFVRYDIGHAKDMAPGGGKVGMSVAQIHALYGEHVQTLPHKYVEGASYLRIAEGLSVLLFETDAAGKVTRWRVGVPPQIDYVEGCA